MSDLLPSFPERLLASLTGVLTNTLHQVLNEYIVGFAGGLIFDGSSLKNHVPSSKSHIPIFILLAGVLIIMYGLIMRACTSALIHSVFLILYENPNTYENICQP